MLPAQLREGCGREGGNRWEGEDEVRCLLMEGGDLLPMQLRGGCGKKGKGTRERKGGLAGREWDVPGCFWRMKIKLGLGVPHLTDVLQP